MRHADNGQMWGATGKKDIHKAVAHGWGGAVNLNVVSRSIGYPKEVAPWNTRKRPPPSMETGTWQVGMEVREHRFDQKSIEGFREKKMLANKCPDCGTVYFLPKPYCRCLGIPDEFVEIKDIGTVTTYTFTGSWSYGGMADEGASGTPLIIAGIVFDGADTMSITLLKTSNPSR